jgi:hypothetical protein
LDEEYQKYLKGEIRNGNWFIKNPEKLASSFGAFFNCIPWVNSNIKFGELNCCNTQPWNSYFAVVFLPKIIF